MGPYRLEECIGRGSTCLVYSAFDEQIKRRVAIKVLPRHVLADEQIQRFRHEAEIHARLIHPNIVKLYNTFENQGFFALIMELMEGCTLDELLLHKPRLQEGEILSLVHGILSALAKAHAKGIIHQDLKASNVFLCNDGTVKIKDFGLAAFKGSSNASEPAQTHSSTSESLQQRYAYMPPEQILGKACTSHSDLYSFGVLLYEISTGKLPFSSDDKNKRISDFEMMEKQVRESPTPANQLQPDMNKALSDTIMQLLEKKPDDRPKDCREVWAMLSKVTRPVRLQITGKSLSDLHTRPELSPNPSTKPSSHISQAGGKETDQRDFNQTAGLAPATLMGVIQQANRNPTENQTSAAIKLDPSILSRLKKAIANLPPMPDIWHLVQAVLESDEPSPADLAAVIRTDPVLSAHVLGLANSAAYSAHDREMSNISMAIARIGMDDIQSFLIQKLTPDFSRLSSHAGKRGTPIKEEMRQIWLHSQAIGKLAASMAGFSPTCPASTVRMFGMMHDIGKLVILHIENDEKLEYMKLSMLEGMPSLDAERQSLGYTHIDAGMMLALHWKLPRPLQQFIHLHHAPEFDNPDHWPDNIRQPLLLVHTAHLLVHAIRAANGAVESIWASAEHGHPAGMGKRLANQCQLPLDDEHLYQRLCDEYVWVEGSFFQSMAG